jgi:uncharacterized damage-inducible protein DinB
MAGMQTNQPIPDSAVPRSIVPAFQHALDTYASETNKTAEVWRQFSDADLGWRPHPRSSTVADILKHQLLSERRFFGEFLGTAEPSVADILPPQPGVGAFTRRLVELAAPRLAFLAVQPQDWWLAVVPFFDVQRERAWIFWRRILHTAHHRTQLTVYLRLLDRPVPSVYGPTADVTWKGADPTHTTEAAGRK